MHTIRNERGAAAVELALVLPILVMLVFGLIEAGRYYNNQLSLSHAAREAARVLALGGTVSDATSRVGAADDGQTGVTVAATACPATPTNPPADATVTVSRPFTFDIPFVTLSLPGGAVSSTAVMRCGG